METGSTSVADNVPYGLYGKIVRTAEVVRGGIKGLLVWDAIIFNEITFQEAITHKKTSLYTCWDDQEAKKVFDRLVEEYRCDAQVETTNENSADHKRMLMIFAKEFIDGEKSPKTHKEEYGQLLNEFEKLLSCASKEDPCYEVYNKLMDLL